MGRGRRRPDMLKERLKRIFPLPADSDASAQVPMGVMPIRIGAPSFHRKPRNVFLVVGHTMRWSPLTASVTGVPPAVLPEAGESR